MMKIAASALAAFYQDAIAGPDAADHAKARFLPSMVDALAADTVDLVERAPAVSAAYQRLREAASHYASADPRRRQDMIVRRHQLKLALHAFAVALDGAKVDEAVAFVAGVNTAQVPNPIAAPL